MRRNISDLSSKNTTKIEGYDFHFLLSAWEGTRVPWYQLYLASRVLDKGLSVYFIIDHFAYLYYPIHLVFYRIFRSVNFRKYKQHRRVALKLKFEERKNILIAVRANIKWYTKSELFVEKLHKIVLRTFYKRQVNHYQKVKNKLAEFTEKDIIIIPGGVLNPSFSYVNACNVLGLKYYTYDSGSDGEVIFARASIAAHLKEIENYDIKNIHPLQKEQLLCSADELIKNRMNSADQFKYQKVPTGGAEYLEYIDENKMNILVPLSCPWDAASLMRKDLFNSELSFIKKVLCEYEGCNIIVRVHPIERVGSNARNDNLVNIYKKYTNVRIITPEKSVNTYDLLDAVDLVICQNTSLGAEAVICGNTAISTTISYWNDTPGLVQTTLKVDCIKMRYALAQVYNWNFPMVNLNNVSPYLISTDSFDEFTSTVIDYKTHTEIKIRGI